MPKSPPVPAIKAIAGVVRSALPPHHKAVLVSLLTRAHWDESEGHYVCWPSYETIASDASVSRAAVARALAQLRAQNAFTSSVTAEKGGSAYYRINLNGCANLPERKRGDPNIKFPTPHRKARTRE